MASEFTMDDYFENGNLENEKRLELFQKNHDKKVEETRKSIMKLLDKKDIELNKRIQEAKNKILSDNTDSGSKEKIILSLTTTTTNAKYASYRLMNSEIARWPPLMSVVNKFLETSYQRKSIVTEMALAMIELCLDVPIQFDMMRDGVKIDLETPGVINYNDKCFENAIEIIRDLLDKSIITRDQLRIPYEIIEKKQKRSI